MDDFIIEIAEILEVDNVEMTQELESFECWDSLTILSIIALSDEIYKVTLSADEVNNAKTIGGLKEMINAKMNGK